MNEADIIDKLIKHLSTVDSKAELYGTFDALLSATAESCLGDDAFHKVLPVFILVKAYTHARKHVPTDDPELIAGAMCEFFHDVRNGFMRAIKEKI